MKVKGYWLDIPGHWLEGGKRFIATAYGWEKLRKRYLGRFCVLCSRHYGIDLHHEKGRGGGRRDDRKTIWVCRWCHSKEHNQ